MTAMEELKAIVSPEWGLTDDGYITSQYGARLHFESSGAGQVHFSFLEEHPDLSFAWYMDGKKVADLGLEGHDLTVKLPAGDHDQQLILQQWATGQVDFWRQGVVLTDFSTDTEVTAPILDGAYWTFVGDSITAGELMEGRQHRPDLSFPAIVAKHFQRPLARIAYGGTGLTVRAPFQEPTAIQALWQVGPDLMRPRPQTDLVIVNYGLNDANYGASRQEFAFGLRVYLLELIKRFHQARMVLVTPLNGAFVDVFKEEVARFDCFEILDSSEWGIMPEGRHPNVSEHQAIAAKIIEYLED
ncbi:GDSL-type esterase/lipase family protein [Eupransor demetentiae]|uniref:Lysophospholipase L1 or related esterase. Includes spore coat protein LipC/YcsK (TesA) n=1 Tax=Eupransor demetentiae TaxID=3109584 RepID=A0ABM9N4I0_9LACO|nr:Lysophospholipase L1 or related esterase. Includes spore coat protein LipC/YcsK (TesA) [Lactobacillaceae bacterium LMG 33000]